MDHRRVIASVVAVAAVGTATAVTLPAIASSQPQPDPSARADSVLVSALRRDLNLSDEQARARLRTERWASPTGERLRRQLGARYAGAWLSATGDRLTVAVTDPRLADPVRAAGAEPKIVTRSAGDLDTLKGDLDRRAGTVGDDVPGWYVDVATNSVVVLAKPRARAAAARWAAAGGAPADAVRVVESAENPRPLFDVRGGDAFFAGRGRCSIGFSVVGGFVTAGHCGPVGTQAAGFNRAAQGQVAASVFPGAGDFGFVRVNADWTPRSVVNTSTGGEVPVAGSAEAPVGASICRTGSTTGTRCGVIAAKNATVNYAEGAVSGLTRTDVCAEPGDSGGSWLSGDQAQGVTSGGSGDCTSGGVT
ncbi:MAG TPA: S1 family peptidase, partial [Pilimelia sp.]|nr:S1 family peptidase [Pilimelia sp.]